MTKKHVALIVGLVLIAVFALIDGLLFRVKTVTVDFDTETSIQAEDGEAERIIAASGLKKGKNIFGVSESRMIKNINAALPGVRVVNIERIFPNRIVIHVSKRVPVYLIKYRQNTSDVAKYVVVDGDMVVLGFYDEKPDEPYVSVDGFELIGKYTIETGKTLPVEFGNSIYYLQNVAAGLYNCNLTPAQFIAFIAKVKFENGIIDLCTRSGAVMRLGGNLTTEQVSARVPLAYSWYMNIPEGDEKRSSKYIARYDIDENKFIEEKVY